MEKLLKLASGAYQAFKGSTREEKRELLGFVFLNLQLNGAKLCYSLNFPFNRFENVAKTKEWLPVLTTLRTDPELRVRIIQHKINRGHSEFLERIAA